MKRSTWSSTVSPAPSLFSALHHVVFTSYGLSVPSPFAFIETKPPCLSTRRQSSRISSSGRIPRAPITPMPSCESRKLKNADVSEGGSSARAHCPSVRASPRWNAWRTSGGSAKL